ncbi:shugoshin-1 isoform X2 [Ananas comosus]|uniref:Shugoshin-1 isoform X2 n=1 Tax=Ananas comosus TaxID=4615 RepID=A0A6P5H6B1_ANACO|nr:shugoshin-1 isoform X2 [Ananas comosus]
MEGAPLFSWELDAVGGGAVILVGENPKFGRNKKKGLIGSKSRRQTLSDITNTGRNQENPNTTIYPDSKDLIELTKGKSELLKLLGERNKTFEESNSELQKLRVALHKANQQNRELAQANSRMLMELNSGKDRLKELQHELGCTTAVLRTKTLEMEEKDKLIKELSKKIGFEIVADAPHPASAHKKRKPNRKHTLENQALQGKDHRRRSLRRRSIKLTSESSEPSEDSFEIEDTKISVCSLTGKASDENSSFQLENSTPGSSAFHEQMKNESNSDYSSGSLKSCIQELKISSNGRPMRRAAEKVPSYKELPLNVKMRRP